MKHRQTIVALFGLCLFASMLTITNLFQTINETPKIDSKSLFSAQGYGEFEIKPEEIWQNSSYIERGVSSVNITVNASRLEDLNGVAANAVNLTLNYPNGTVTNLTMAQDIVTNIWSIEIAPGLNEQRGMYSYFLNIMNSTPGLMHNTTAMDGSFTVGNIDPGITIELSSLSVYITENLNLTFNVSDPDNIPADFNLNFKIYNPSQTLVSENTYNGQSNGIWENILTVSYSTTGVHIIRATLSDGTNTIFENYTFYVGDPSFTIESIEFSPSTRTLYRGPNDSLEITVNLTTILQAGVISAFNPTVKLKTIFGALTTPKEFTISYRVTEGVYRSDVSFEYSDPAGIYTCWVGVVDKYGNEKISNFVNITVSNNPPTMKNITINGEKVTNEFKINQGKSLNCTFGTSDPEKSVKLLGVNLVGSGNQYFNYSQASSYGNSIIIDSTHLSAGVWSFQFYVEDVDGGVGYLDSVILVRVSVDPFEQAVPYITFVVGLIIGLGVGVAILWRKYSQLKNAPGKSIDTSGSQLIPKKRPRTKSKKARTVDQEPTPKPEDSEKKKAPEEKKPKKSKGPRTIRRKIS